MAQLQLLFPLSGLFTADSSSLKFKWFSFISLLSFVFLALNLMNFILESRIILENDLNLGTSSVLIFSFAFLLGNLLLILLAHQWPTIILQWRQVEKIFLQSDMYSVGVGFDLRKKIMRIWCIMLVLMIVENNLYFGSTSIFDWKVVDTCQLEIDVWEYYYHAEKSYISQVI